MKSSSLNSSVVVSHCTLNIPSSALAFEHRSLSVPGAGLLGGYGAVLGGVLQPYAGYAYPPGHGPAPPGSPPGYRPALPPVCAPIRTKPLRTSSGSDSSRYALSREPSRHGVEHGALWESRV